MSSPASLATNGRALDLGAMALITLVCLSWGLNQVAVKFSLPEFPPLVQASIRTGGGMLIVLAWVCWRRINILTRDGTLVPGLIAGLLFAGEFAMIFYGLTLTSASRASLFIYSAPVFVALGARWLLPNENLTRAQWFGLLLCFLGVASAIGFPGAAADTRMLAGDALAIGAGAAWAATTLVIKTTSLAKALPEKTLIYQVGVSAPVFVAISLALGEQVAPSFSVIPVSWLIYQIFVVGLTFPVWFAFIQRYSATRVSAFTFLTPLFGVVAGVLLLGEPFTVTFGIAVALVIAGLILVNRSRQG